MSQVLKGEAMPRRKVGRISDAELARRRRRGATLRELAEASGLDAATVQRRLGPIER
jgi:hypothetical protein